MQIKVPMGNPPESIKTGTQISHSVLPPTMSFEDAEVPDTDTSMPAYPIGAPEDAFDAFVDDDLLGFQASGIGVPGEVANQSLHDMTEEQLDGFLDEYRKKAGTASTVLVAGIVATLLFAWIGLGMLCFLGIVAAVVGGVMFSRARKEYRVDEINELIAHRALTGVFPGASILRDIPPYKKDELDVQFKHFYNKKAKSYYNNFHVNDLVWGTYDGNPFEFCDIHATYEYTDSDGDTHTTEIFTGQYLRFPTQKTLSCDLFIRRKSGRERKKEKDGGILTDNPEFNEKWHITSDSEENALYVLTPHFMEKLEEYETAISKSMGIAGKTDYIFRADGSFVAFVESNSNLFEMERIRIRDAEGNIVKGRNAKVADIQNHYKAETEWMRAVMDVLRFD